MVPKSHGEESWTLRSAEKILKVQGRLPLLNQGTCLEPSKHRSSPLQPTFPALESSGHRILGEFRNRMLLVWSGFQSRKPVSRSSDTSKSRGKTTTSTLREEPRVLRTQEPRSHLGQDTSRFCLQ